MAKRSYNSSPIRDEIKDTIANLSGDSIDCTAIHIDWREMAGEDCEGWQSFEANECDKCGAVVVLNAGRGGESHKDVDDAFDLDDATCPKCGERDVSEVRDTALHCGSCGNEWPDPRSCDGHVSTAEGPMMNYWYPLKLDDCKAAAAKLGNLPLCVVEFKDGETGLALTGGGMNLAREICLAFINLGSMPPVEFSRIPHMAGMVLDETNRLIFAACIESNRVAKQRADWNIRDLKATMATIGLEATRRERDEKKASKKKK